MYKPSKKHVLVHTDPFSWVYEKCNPNLMELTCATLLLKKNNRKTCWALQTQDAAAQTVCWQLFSVEFNRSYAKQPLDSPRPLASVVNEAAFHKNQTYQQTNGWFTLKMGASMKFWRCRNWKSSFLRFHVNFGGCMLTGNDDGPHLVISLYPKFAVHIINTH